jgi:hypothetical protein
MNDAIPMVMTGYTYDKCSSNVTFGDIWHNMGWNKGITFEQCS